MKYHLHENKWTVLLDNFDYATATQSDIDHIACLLATNTLVIARNQTLTVQDELRVSEMFGVVQDVSALAHVPPYKSILVDGSHNKVVRVTGELDEHGQPGLFGHVSELDWHCNQAATPTRKPLVWLRGLRGTAGSRTSWLNNIMSYNDLANENKAALTDLKMFCGFAVRHGYSEFDFNDKTEEDYNEHYTPRLVHTNIGGQTGLFFPFLQIRNFVGLSEDHSRTIISDLRHHVLQEKYMYHHDWQDGDVVIAEQWLGLHKRWKFDDMPTRVLHRTAFDFAHSDLSGIA